MNLLIFSLHSAQIQWYSIMYVVEFVCGRTAETPVFNCFVRNKNYYLKLFSNVMIFMELLNTFNCVRNCKDG